MQRVYSERFALATITSSGSHDLYTVPAGYRAILRDVDALTVGSTGFEVSLQASGVTVVYWPAGGAGVTALPWRGRQVLYEGETLSAVATLPSGGQLNVTASGYLLTLP